MNHASIRLVSDPSLHCVSLFLPALEIAIIWIFKVEDSSLKSESIISCDGIISCLGEFSEMNSFGVSYLPVKQLHRILSISCPEV